MLIKMLFKLATLANIIFVYMNYKTDNVKGVIVCGIYAIVMAIWSIDDINKI